MKVPTVDVRMGPLVADKDSNQPKHYIKLHPNLTLVLLNPSVNTMCNNHCISYGFAAIDQLLARQDLLVHFTCAKEHCH